MDDKIANYIEAHYNSKFINKLPYVFFSNIHLIFGKEYIMARYNINKEDIIIKKELNVISDNYHFPYVCGEFSTESSKADAFTTAFENRLGYCSTICNCESKHSNWIHDYNYECDSYLNIGLKYEVYQNKDETIQEFAKRNEYESYNLYNPYTYLNYNCDDDANKYMTHKSVCGNYNKCCHQTTIKKRYLLFTNKQS